MLKAAFPLTASNTSATYDLGMGTIQRGNNVSNAYEVPAQQWADITCEDSSYGVSILNDCRYGWDKPYDNTLRLTFFHTPALNTRYTEQRTLDFGQHLLTYAIAPHDGSWQQGQIPLRAARLNQPLVTYQSEKHAGSCGKEYSFLQISNPQIAVKAIKKAQRSDDIIVRFQELNGSSASDVQVTVGEGVVSARQVDGCEQDLTSALVVDDKLVFSMTKYQPKTFALTLDGPTASIDAPVTSCLTIPYNLDAFSWDEDYSDGDFTNSLTYPAELISDSIEVTGIPYQIGSRNNGEYNAVACAGQTISLGSDDYKSIYFLAASRNGDRKAAFTIDGKPITVDIQDYHEKVVDWGRENERPYLKRDTVAWVGTHRHSTDGNQSYEFCYMFQYKIDIPTGADAVTLPNDDDIVMFAMTAANVPANSVQPAGQVIDTLPYIPDLVPLSDSRVTNLALNKHVAADSYVPGEYPELIVDGSTRDNSKWCAVDSTIVPHWLILDLGQEYYVDTFVLRHAGDGGETSGWNTCDYCIQASSDGENNWEDLVCVEGNEDNVTTDTLVEPVLVRYLRLYVTQPVQYDSTSLALRIYEFEVYGPCDGIWLQGDSTSDCVVNIEDLGKTAEEWLLCNDPDNVDCLDYWLDRFPDIVPADETFDSSTDVVPNDHLVAYWKMQQGSGNTVYDLAGGDDNGTMLGATLPAWSSGWFPQDGTSDYSLYFNSSNCVKIDSISNELSSLEDEITISAWFNADNLDGNNRILQKGGSDNQYRILSERGYMVFDLYGVGSLSTDLPSTGQWHHIAGTYNGTIMRLYIDGLEKAKIYTSEKIHQTNDKIYIGAKSTTSATKDFFKGYLDDIRIYSVGLTAEQVRTLAREGKNIPPLVSEIGFRDSVLVSILGSSFLSTNVFDINGDDVSVQWTEADHSPYAFFYPSDSQEDTNVYFTEPGRLYGFVNG